MLRVPQDRSGMAPIAREIEEWAVVDRLRTLLETSTQGDLDVTHPFALFSAVCMWVRWRLGSYTSYAEWPEGLDDLRKLATDVRWGLPGDSGGGTAQRIKLFSDGPKTPVTLPNCTAWEFVVWVRNAIAHGDHRSIRPVHNATRTLIGFHLEYGAWAKLEGRFMQSFGMNLATVFCTAYDRV
jgi:hypothetical protein